MPNKELETVEKKAVETTEEMTWAGRTYRPSVDIWENEAALTIAADVPGVRKEDLEIGLKDDVLTIQANLSLNRYEGLRAVYSEYNVGNFYRRFSLGESIEQEQISANVEDGVLTLTLPKKEKAQRRSITVH